ncbi:MAG: hypothetical protein COB38_03995 [Gammaproteobacteria bacterium]|nr:MAG: hypothetical protein COB38_03995 [Gammaproteobacteria bacterium]
MTSLLTKFPNPTFALLWYMVKQNRWGIIGLFSSIPMVLLLDFISTLIFDSSFLGWSSKVSLMLLIMLLPLLAMIVTYGELSTKTAKTGIPRITFTHPVSSHHLAVVPIVFGITLSFTFMSFWFLLIAQTDYSLFEYSIVLTTCIICVAWLQFIAWRLSDTPYLTIITFITLVGLLFVFIVSLWNADSTPPLISVYLAQLGLALLATSGLWLAVNSVKKERTHQTIGKKWKLSEIQFIGFSLPTIYESKQHALFRYEWRVCGWILPIAGIFMASIFTFTLFSLESNRKVFDLIAIISFSLIYLPLFSPAAMSKNYLGSKSSSILSFTAQLPMSNFDLAMSKLKLTLRSTGLFLLIVLLPINLFLLSLEIGDNVFQPWSWLINHFGSFKAVTIWVFINGLIPASIWSFNSNILSWGLNGRPFYSPKVMTIGSIAISFIALISYRFYISDEFKNWIIDLIPALTILLFLTIGLFLSWAIKRFNNAYTDDKKRIGLKKVYLTAISFMTYSLLTLWLVNLNADVNFYGSFIICNITMLGILPYLTAPFFIKVNRSR